MIMSKLCLRGTPQINGQLGVRRSRYGEKKKLSS